MKKDLSLVEGIHDYVLRNSLRDSELLQRLRDETLQDRQSIMQVPPEQGQLLALLVKLIGAKRTVEIGVYTGYSTLCVALAMPEDSYTLACDVEESWTGIAKRYWTEAGVAHKIDLRLAPAAATLNAALAAGEAESYDFVFIDADKSSYDTYYELALRLVRPGGLIAIDNVLFFGAVVNSNVLETRTLQRIGEATLQVLRDLNNKIRDDQRVDLSMLQIADGLTLVRKR
ncbi:MAG TPA: class I SAM-dependent methyltransferase [Steroidobacteraceae bacterium]|jgi:predicted O-methyltransferase YrrM